MQTVSIIEGMGTISFVKIKKSLSCAQSNCKKLKEKNVIIVHCISRKVFTSGD